MSAEEGTEVFGGGEFGVVDYVVLTVLTMISIVAGTSLAIRKNKNNNADDYLLGGRSMGIVPVALSLLGGFVSAISILGNATEMYYNGTQLSLSLLGSLWGVIISSQLVLPVLFPLKLVSVYEYLQLRFNSRILKKLASLSQILNVAFYLGVCLYAPSLSFSTVTNIPTWISVVSMGIICTVYVTIGGVRAVVYTDVLQTSIMFFGVAIIVLKTTVGLGGFWTVWDLAGEGDRLEFFNMDPSPLVRHSFWSVQVLGIYFIFSVLTLSQGQFQRLISVRTLEQSQRLCFLFWFGVLILWTIFNFSGLVAYAQYKDCDPLTAGLIDKKDGIIPFLVLDQFGNGLGLVGLFVAAIYGGVLSSVSTCANAVATLLWKDFLSEMNYFSRMSDASATKTIKILSAFSGLVAIIVALLVAKMGTIFELANTVSAAIGSPLDALFVCGIFAPWVTNKGAITGFSTGLILNLLLLWGRKKYDAGRYDPLPLSIEGCPSDVISMQTNITAAVTAVLSNETHWETVNCTEGTVVQTTLAEERDYPAFLDISYCYIGPLSIFLVLIVASIVSFATGANRPHDVDPRLVNKTCLKIYLNIWKRFNKKAVNSFQEENAKEVEMKRLSEDGEEEPLNQVDPSTIVVTKREESL
ncbi:sodium-coupled monocarboxylate transporter 1-like [Oratosquilla oratoria]|uniref:sodium-coupled monocarboxylate transporter 1-like n=1 Tax=Oratosquilla oratoria TaxID=337810 RepID=UPI003F7656ED